MKATQSSSFSSGSSSTTCFQGYVCRVHPVFFPSSDPQWFLSVGHSRWSDCSGAQSRQQRAGALLDRDCVPSAHRVASRPDTRACAQVSKDDQSSAVRELPGSRHQAGQSVQPEFGLSEKLTVIRALDLQYGYPFARAWVREIMAPIAISCYKTLKLKAIEDAKPKEGAADRSGYTVSHPAVLVSPLACD